MLLAPTWWMSVCVFAAASMIAACGGDDSGGGGTDDTSTPADSTVTSDTSVVSETREDTSRDSEPTETVTETSVTETVLTETTTDTVTDTATTETSDDVTTDTGPGETTDSQVAETSDDADVGPVPCTGLTREDGCACENDTDCTSGLCASGPMGDYCTGRCGTGSPCADGTTCVTASGQTQGLCLVEEDFLCMPCKTDGDCRKAGGDATCHSLGAGGSFCALACDDGNPCIDGYTCTSGACVPADNSCECSEVASELGARTTCSNSNGLGSCVADRICEANGNLTPCVAPAPTNEICDGVDNDCNTGTPETNALCDDKDSCTSNTCTGVGGCKYDKLSGTSCDDGDPCTTNDTCSNGVCSGTDSCPCTQATAAADCTTPPEGQTLSCLTPSCVDNKCQFTPKSGSCNDGSACTTGDTCTDGVCGGTTRDCSDPDLCTADSCDPATGCKNIPFTGSCEDGDPCTVGDTCATGQCVGTTLDCSDLDSSCYIGVCDGGGGCTTQALACGVSGLRMHTPSAAFSQKGAGTIWFQGSAGHGGPVGEGSTAVRKVQFGFHPGMRR